ncbi:hypothetical protein ACKWTF_016294 [Chironomus riparius]
MSEKLIDALKPIKYFGNIFGFFPFCLDKNHENYLGFLYLNYTYSIILIFLMVYGLHFNVTIAITWFREASMMPEIVHQIIQALPMTISTIHVLGSLLHRPEFMKLLRKFDEIDKKVSCSPLIKVLILAHKYMFSWKNQAITLNFVAF